MKRYLLIIIAFGLILFVGYIIINNQNIKIFNINSKSKLHEVTKPSTLSTKEIFAKSKFSQNTNIIINEQSNKGDSLFYLGMTKQDVLSKINIMELEIVNEIEITSNEKAWDFGNEVILLEDFYFVFDKNDNLYEIVIQKNLSTALGLNLGSTLDDMEKLYGKDYIFYQNGKICVYEYAVDEHYFRVYIEDGKINKWAISKYKYDK